VEERTGEQQQVRKRAEQVRAVLGPQEEERDRRESDQRDRRGGVPA
jgi:hypothetical protein